MMEILTVIITAVLRALIPALFDAAKPRMEEGAADTRRRDALRDRIRGAWTPQARRAAEGGAL
jgi:hypothetical protein